MLKTNFSFESQNQKEEEKLREELERVERREEDLQKKDPEAYKDLEAYAEFQNKKRKNEMRQMICQTCVLRLIHCSINWRSPFVHKQKSLVTG